MKGKVWTVAQIVLGLFVSGLLGWLAARGLDWSAVLATFRQTSLPLLILAVSLFLIAGYIRAARWRILFINERISISRLFIIQNEGIGLNNVMPIRVVSEAVQLAVLASKDRIRGPKALAALSMERVIDAITSTVMLALAILFVPELRGMAPYVWGLVGLAVVITVVVRLLMWGSDAISIIRRISFISAFSIAVKELEREKGRLVASLILTVAYWGMVGLTAWIVANAINLPISPVTATLVIMGTIFFATTVPAAPSAIGTFEFALVKALGFFGVANEVAFGFAVMTHLVFFLPPTIIAAVFLPREGLMSVGRMRALAIRMVGAGHSSTV